MLAALSRSHIAKAGRLGSGPAHGPQRWGEVAEWSESRKAVRGSRRYRREVLDQPNPPRPHHPLVIPPE
jgi:hypothetical protein